jgi:DNA polymerase III sliding clamp (beta) subunit (PCNA family)
LNGLLLSLDKLRAVATDGHRMAIVKFPEKSNRTKRVIVPQGIQEVMRLLDDLKAWSNSSRR